MTRETEWECTQCGASGVLTHADETLMTRVLQDVENVHAAARPECPINRQYLKIFLGT